MKTWGAASCISIGGVLDELFRFRHLDWPWMVVLLVSLTGWAWAALAASISAILRRLFSITTGRAYPLPATDPQALAAEIAALNAQIAQLRDTATSFDVSFDETLQRLDERLRRVEQQSPFVQIRR